MYPCVYASTNAFLGIVLLSVSSALTSFLKIQTDYLVAPLFILFQIENLNGSQRVCGEHPNAIEMKGLI